MFPHAGVHCGSDNNGSSHREMEGRQEVVGYAIRKLCNAVRSGRRNEKEIRGLRHQDVIESAFKVATRSLAFKDVDVNLIARQRAECQRGDELRCTLRHQDIDVDGAILKPSHDLGRLVAGNAAADSECDFHDVLFGFFFFLVVTVAVWNSKLYEAIKDFFLSNLCRLVTRLFDHRHAAGLDLARAQCRENHKAIFAIDIVGDRYQAEPPKEVIISSMRPCWCEGLAVPQRTMDSRRRMEFSRTSLMMM